MKFTIQIKFSEDYTYKIYIKNKDIENKITKYKKIKNKKKKHVYKSVQKRMENIVIHLPY